jgi:thiol-disulfide isomerase/thioredoxin
MKRLITITAAFVALAVTSFAVALEKSAYSDAVFSNAQQSGQPILIEIYASWCPVCKAQGKVLEKLAAKPEYKNLKVIRVDFDSQKDAVRKFGARQQSTLIAYKGSKETKRLAYTSDAQAIEDVVKSAY